LAGFRTPPQRSRKDYCRQANLLSFGDTVAVHSRKIEMWSYAMRTDPVATFVLLLVIGIVAGLIFDRFAGPGWLTRQIAGSTRGMVTSSLIGIAGAFIGFHLVTFMAGGYAPFIGAVIGAAVVLWLWRVMR
jgi:uncharacterized membrane protein YeaQ/YmgE (transglycosylase-associated protein family)